MVSLLGDPDAVHRLAVSYRDKAGQLHDAGSRFAQQAQHSRWTCAKADRFRGDAGSMSRECDKLAGEMMDIYADLLKLEATIRAELAALENIERKVRDFFAVHRPHFGFDGLPHIWPWDHLPWKPDNLPALHSPDWNRVIRDLKLNGAPL